jgi:ergothioneine biosynthesis protein EgtB
MSPLYPAYDRSQPAAHEDWPAGWLEFRGGVSLMGHDGSGFGYDNEFPRHRVFIEPFKLAQALVTNAEYLAFIDAGGYADAALWLSEGWDWRCSLGLSAPLYWLRGDGQAGQWQEFTLHGLQPLEPHAPVNHLSYFEADAYARWRDARLPTEAEWEHAAVTEGGSLRELFGSRWQWTSSSYSPYPGYRPAAGAIGEYNGKFMINQTILRGSSSATAQGHSRHSYRNFFPASARWQFTGLRLAQS